MDMPAWLQKTVGTLGLLSAPAMVVMEQKKHDTAEHPVPMAAQAVPATPASARPEAEPISQRAAPEQPDTEQKWASLAVRGTQSTERTR